MTRSEISISNPGLSIQEVYAERMRSVSMEIKQAPLQLRRYISSSFLLGVALGHTQGLPHLGWSRTACYSMA